MAQFKARVRAQGFLFLEKSYEPGIRWGKRQKHAGESKGKNLLVVCCKGRMGNNSNYLFLIIYQS
jgi:hypothetical protein